MPDIFSGCKTRDAIEERLIMLAESDRLNATDILLTDDPMVLETALQICLGVHEQETEGPFGRGLNPSEPDARDIPESLAGYLIHLEPTTDDVKAIAVKTGARNGPRIQKRGRALLGTTAGDRDAVQVGVYETIPLPSDVPLSTALTILKNCGAGCTRTVRADARARREKVRERPREVALEADPPGKKEARNGRR